MNQQLTNAIRTIEEGTVTYRQAAEILGVHEAYARRLVDDGTAKEGTEESGHVALETVSVCGRVLITKESVDAVVEFREMQAEAKAQSKQAKDAAKQAVADRRAAKLAAKQAAEEKAAADKAAGINTPAEVADPVDSDEGVEDEEAFEDDEDEEAFEDDEDEDDDEE